MQPKRFIISGGGTGGHIFPAVAIANEIKRREPEADILFVGALGKMEMEKVPAAGYRIVGLKIAGIRRAFTLSNLMVPFRLIGALLKARGIIKEHKPNVVIGVGGYASSAVLYAAAQMGIPTLIQEQNSHAGITNKILGKRAKRICVAYEGMEKYFPKNRILLTGNPVRSEIVAQNTQREEAIKAFGLDYQLLTILIVGGSLGARSINQAIEESLPKLMQLNIQIIWQTGKGNADAAHKAAAAFGNKVKVYEFIQRMDQAYAASDLVISRAGALAVSELCMVSKPAILVPFPFAAEDHQTSNAQALSNKGAAVLIPDAEVKIMLYDAISELVKNPEKRSRMATAMASLAKPDATRHIVDEIFKLIPAA